MELTKEKEWTYRKMDCARYSVEVDGLDFDLDVRVEGSMIECRSVPSPVSYSPVAPKDYQTNRKAWFVGSQQAGGGGNKFSTVVRIEEKLDPDTDKISEKYTVSTLRDDGGFDDEIDLVFWGDEIDAEEGDRVYISAGFSQFKGESYLSVSDYGDIQILEASMTVEDICEYCKDAEKAVDDDFERDMTDASDEQEQEGLDAFTTEKVS